MIVQIMIFNYMLLMEMIFGHVSMINSSTPDTIFILEPLVSITEPFILIFVALFVIFILGIVFSGIATFLIFAGIGVILFVILLTLKELVIVIWNMTFGAFL